MKRDLTFFLVLEVVAVVWAGSAFALISSRLLAGLAAGAYFIGSAGWMLARIRRWPAPRRSLTLYPLVVHLFAISIPMVVTRALYAGEDFANVRILGLEGPLFHRLSTTVFGGLVAATLVDRVRVGFRK